MKKIITLVLILILSIFLMSCGEKTDVQREQMQIDTTCFIKICDIEKDRGEELLDESFEMAKKYEELFSKTIKGSDIYRLNHSNGKAVKLDDETIKLLKKSIELSRMSDGRFDVTIGKLTSLWDFKSSSPKVPKEDKIKAGVETVNYKNIEINGNLVKLKDKNIQVDLGGIAKGYIGDKITEFLMEEGVESGLVNLGGNALTIGKKTDGNKWRIGIEKPYSKRQDLVAVVELEDETVVTSGIYERMFIKNGYTYHHVLNPKTGYPVENGLASVSVKTKIGKSYIADGLSTSFLLMGEKKALEKAEELEDIEILIVRKDGSIVQSSGFDGIDN